MIIRVALMLLVVTQILACSFRSPQPMDEDAHAKDSSAATEPLVQFIRSAKEGAESFIVNTRHGDVRVRIDKEYFAASGKECKRARLETQDGCEIEMVVCREGQGEWKEEPILWDGCK